LDQDDRQLLIATHRGHHASACLLWERHAPRLAAHARAILRDPGAADDAVQAVMCRVLELPGRRVRAIDDVAAYLCGAVRREALNQIRAARRARIRHASPRLQAPLEPGGADGLAAALEQLPRRLREVVVLRHVSQLTFDQMAVALGANRNTVAGRYRAALKALREWLAPPRGVTHV
jgi:RNA polymerase sigma-70 factor (ECF subfamily)